MDGMTRRDVLRALGVSAAGAAGGRLFAAGAVPRRPNVILILTDDQGYGDLGCHGNPVLRTPNLDRLHAQSVRLADFHVDPTCSPTRSALLTGRYSSRVGVWHTVMGREFLRRDETTMADVFRAGGYRTGIFGKWHLGDAWPYRPRDRGFDEALVHHSGAVGQVGDWWGNDYFDDTYRHNDRPEKVSGYCTDVRFDRAMKFIRDCAGRPFFCYLPTNAPHEPYHVADAYSRPYREKGLPKDLSDFYGMIANIDENVGRLLRFLEETGLGEDTILIFMTDNGTSGGGFNAGLRKKKGSEYDGGHRVPCFIRWPAGRIGGSRDAAPLAAHIDLLPTLIDLCGLPAPRGVKFDGASLAPLLRGGAEGWPARILVVHSQRIDFPEKWRQSAVMTDRWRLVNGRELYDMPADPGQKNDVAGRHPDVAAKLREAYEAWWADISTRFGEYCRIVLGDEKGGPAELNLMDWHGPDGARTARSDSESVRQGVEANGFWAVEVARDGTHDVALRRWPEELDRPITAEIEGGRAIRADKARLKIGPAEWTQPVSPGAAAVTFRVELKAGETELQTWFLDGDRTPRGAYYVYVKRVESGKKGT